MSCAHSSGVISARVAASAARSAWIQVHSVALSIARSLDPNWSVFLTDMVSLVDQFVKAIREGESWPDHIRVC